MVVCIRLMSTGLDPTFINTTENIWKIDSIQVMITADMRVFDITEHMEVWYYQSMRSISMLNQVSFLPP